MSPHDEEPVKHNSEMPGMQGATATGKVAAEWSARGHVSEQTIYAWLDGALDAADKGTVQVHLDACADCQALLVEARGYVAATSRIIGMADLLTRSGGRALTQKATQQGTRPSSDTVVRPMRSAPLPHLDAHDVPRSEQPRIRHWFARPGLQVAAGLLLMAGAGAYVMTSGDTATPVSGIRAATETATNNEKAAVTAPSLTSGGPRDKLAASSTAAKRKKVAGSKDAGTVAGTVAETDVGTVAGTVMATPPTTAAMPSARVPAPLPSLVGKSKSAFAFPSTIRPADPFVPRITVVGMVTTPEGRAIEGAQVTEIGGVNGAVTNSNGEFVIRNVPATANLQLRRIGYIGTRVEMPGIVNDTARLGAQLVPSVNQLAAVTVVDSRVPRVEARVERCLRITVDSASAVGAPFLRIDGSLDQPGSHRLTLVGWPEGAARTAAEFLVSADRTVRATVASASARLDMALSRTGDRWSGTVVEQRDGRTQRHFVSFVPDSGATWCGR